MKAFINPQDLVDAVDDAKSHLMQRVIFWKKRWGEFQPPAGIMWNWTSVPFDTAAALGVPNDQHGLYTFILCPKVASHPKNHFVLYVGKADKTTLRERFQHYFQEKKKVKRPHICYALNKYEDNLEFCYTTVANQNDIEPGEDALLVALMPPFNEKFPASVSQIIGGLK
jgi:hypothetical protein